MAIVEKVLGSDIVLLWFDEHIGHAENCIDLKNEFEETTANSIYLFHDVDRCRQFIRKIRDKKAFCIIQGKYAKTIVPDIMQYTKSPVVYIFCFHMITLTEWAQDIPCVLEGGIFDHEKNLLVKLTTDLSEYASLKVEEYRTKRAACDEWAANLTKTAKRIKTEQCTLPFRTDPLDNQDTPGVQPGE
jgi:hypothetical protein